MGDNECTTSDSESEYEANFRRSRKRALTLSSSSESSSSFGPRRLVSRKKRPRGLGDGFSSSDGSSSSSASSDHLELSPSGSFHLPSDSFDSDDFVVRRLPSWRQRAAVMETSDDSDIVAAPSTRRRATRATIVPESETESDNALDINTPRAPALARTAASARSLAAMQPHPTPTLPSSPAGDLSDSADEGAEKCAICLRSIRAQEVGSPEGCDHTFCLSCLVQWSKSCNRCPMDRQPFTIILVRENVQGQVVRQMTVEERSLPVIVEDTTFCLVCGGFDREDRMLLCDGCDRGFHLECLNPPLADVPEVEQWFCPTCVAWDQVTAEMAARAGNGGDVRDEQRRAEPRRQRLTRATRRRVVAGAGSRQQPPSTSARILIQIERTLRGDWSSPFQPSSSANLDTPPPDQPGTSGTQPSRRAPPKRTTKKKVIKRKKRKTTRRRFTYRKKKVLVENEDGTVTEEIVSVRKEVTRRRRKKKKTVKKKPRATSRRAASSVPAAGGRSVRGRLARTLGVMAPSTPGQLVPEVCSRHRAAPATRVNLSRAMAGIPTLHIFGPRDELAPVSSGSDIEDVGEGGLGLLSRGRVGLSTRPLERRKAIELLRTAPRARPIAHIPQPCEGPSDLLSSILESQTIWHSKKSDVTVHTDGTVELRPKAVDVRNGGTERISSAAPIFPATSSQTGGYRPQTTPSEQPTGGSSSTSPGSSSGTSAPTGSRFGAPRSDREGYANYFNNMPTGSSGPTPFCRGGPPLRFRMPVRPQLRRIPLLPRRAPRALYDDDETEEGAEESEKPEGDKAENEPKQSEEDIDLYSDIETNPTERDGDGSDVEGSSFPALGPPPEPPAFLLSLGMTDEKKLDSDVYDPAEPCDSDEEMVIDESRPPQSDDPPLSLSRTPLVDEPPLPPTPPAPSMTESPPPSANDDDCPVLSLYSSASVEYSRKGEEERARDLADSKLKRQQESPGVARPLSPSREKVGARLSFNVDISSPEDSQDSVAAPRSKSSVNGDGGLSSLESDPENVAATASVVLSLKSPISSPSEVTSPRSRGDSRSPTPSLGERARKISNHSRQSSRSPLSDTPPKRKISAASHRSSGSLERSQPRGGRTRRASYPSGRVSETPDRPKDTSSNSVHPALPANENSSPQDPPRVSTGLEGLDVEEVSSEMEDNDFNGDDCRLSSLSLSGMSNRSRLSSPAQSKKKKRKKKRPKERGKSAKCVSEEGEIDSDKDRGKKSEKREKKDGNIGDENKSDNDKKKKRRSKSNSPDRKILSSRENKKSDKGEKDFSWKKPSKKEKNYREGRKSSKERARSKDRRRSRSSSPRRDKKKSKDRKKSEREKKKEIERYDVRKVVKNKEVPKKDAFGRDLPSKSPSLSRSPSKSRSRSRTRARAPVRRTSRSPSQSSARGFRRGRRRFRSHSRSPDSPRRGKKGLKSSEREGRKTSRSRLRRSRSRRRSISRSPRPLRSDRPAKKLIRARKSWSRSLSLSTSPPSPSPPRVRPEFSPMRVRRSISPQRIRHSFSRSWSRGPSVTREPSMEKLTVVLTSKDKKKKKKRKEDKRIKPADSKKKKAGNSKEVFASGDNVLVSVNFNRTSKSCNIPIVIPSASPVREVSKKKKRSAPDETDRAVKKTKTTSTVSKTIVDAALSTQGSAPKRKKLTRLTEADAEEILSRKPVAVIDLDMSPYREQTPSPVNVVVVSDSGSGEEGKAPAPAIQRPRSPDIVVLPTPAPPVVTAPYLLASSGPKTPPEPPLKFSISKPQQLRPIANPLAEADDGDEEEPAESLDGQTESALDQSGEGPHKGPNTPPEPRGPSTPPHGPSTPPRGPSTPKTPPSPQTSPDAYDPFEPTKSRSPSPMAEPGDAGTDSSLVADSADQSGHGLSAPISLDDTSKNTEHVDATCEDIQFDVVDLETTPAKEPPAPSVEMTELTSSQGAVLSKVAAGATARRSTPQPMTPSTGSTLPLFSLPSPNKTPNRPQSATAGITVSGIQRLQHRLGSPVNKTPNSVKSTPEKRGPDLLSTGNFKIRNTDKRNGPLQDATNETVDMDDSPYSPASSEGDDLFDPPAAPPAAAAAPALLTHKATKPKTTPVKATNKFDLLFGPCGPNLSPLKNGGKKPPKSSKTLAAKPPTAKPSKKSVGKKGVALKMDEDQLRILDEVPSSAVELQVKDKFLKKLNRQERVVDEVKTVLKPHYARKHISKDEYKDILRRAVPKICHSKSGEINPSKIQHLVEAYVRKYRHGKKKGSGAVQKPKLKKTTMFS